MTLRVVSPEQALDLRDKAEASIGRAVREATRSFLSDVKDATLSGLPASPSTLPPSLTASSPAMPLPGGEVPSLGDLVGRWASGMDASVVAAIEAALRRIWRAYTDQGLWLDSPAEREMLRHVALVRDRLVRGTYFGVPVYEESFEAVRRALAQSVAEGWSRQALAQRIAAELSWETDGPYWRQALADTDHRIDSILDGIGPPGNPAREYARLHDPVVQALRNERNIAIRHLDAERSIWQTRANLIARTEATGVANAGAMEAFKAEGATKRMWTATAGGRTRLTHALASGQVAAMGSPFIVGGATLMFPGDPNGPPEEVCNCRCCLVNPDNLTSAQRKTITDIADARSGVMTASSTAADRALAANVEPGIASRTGWLDGPENPLDSLKNANTPGYSGVTGATKDLSLTGNCQKATAAFELRQRGLDAVATLGEGGGPLGTGFLSWFEDAVLATNQHAFKNAANYYEKVLAALKRAYPADSRGALTIQWKNGGGHIFNWIRDADGNITFYDAQTGKIYEAGSDVWARMMSKALSTRLDHLRFVDRGKVALLDPGEQRALTAKLHALQEIQDQANALTRQINDHISAIWTLTGDDLHREQELIKDWRFERDQLLNRIDSLVGTIMGIVKGGG